MKVERSRFLHLVAVIGGSGAACGAQQEIPPAIIVPVDVSPPDAGMPLAVAPAPPVRPEEPSSDAAAPLAHASATGIWSLPWDPSAKPYACADLKCPGPTQEAMGALRTACKAIAKRLATEPFQRFMTCMMSRNNTRDTCDLKRIGDDPDECLEGWTDTPKIDPAAAAKCQPIVAACAGPKQSIHAGGKGISMDDCKKILSVTNAQSEPKMIHCVTEYCGQALHLCHGGFG